MAKKGEISKEEMLNRVVEPIRAEMERGGLLWLRGWDASGGTGLPTNPFRSGDKKGYAGGINNLLLMMSAMRNGWTDPRWTGRGQAKKAKQNIRGLANAKGTMIYAPVLGWYTAEENGVQVRKSYVKAWREVIVFNGEQIIDMPALDKASDEKLDTVTGYERAHAMYEGMDVLTLHQGDAASYSPKSDRISMPVESAFKTLDNYHSTRLHELGHATGHKDRLDRGNFGQVFGSEEYAYEELVAELFAAFACADANIVKTELTTNHAAYLKSWHKKLGDEPEAFIKATTAAWKALEFVRARVA